MDSGPQAPLTVFQACRRRFFVFILDGPFFTKVFSCICFIVRQYFVHSVQYLETILGGGGPLPGPQGVNWDMYRKDISAGGGPLPGP